MDCPLPLIGEPYPLIRGATVDVILVSEQILHGLLLKVMHLLHLFLVYEQLCKQIKMYLLSTAICGERYLELCHRM